MTASGQRIYSQGAEQTAILESVKHLAPGKFLDIGAWHATDKSNPRAYGPVATLTMQRVNRSSS